MTKDNVLFAVIGLLLGLIVGFMFANSVNKAAVSTAGSFQAAPQTSGQPTGQQMANQPEVQAAIEKARAEPQNFEAQVAAAQVYYQIRRFDDAIEFLTVANKLKPDDQDVVIQLGNANFDTGKYDEAEKWYTQAIAKQPENVNVRTDLGLVFMFREPADYDRAIQEFKRSLSYRPDHPQTLQNLTVAYTKKKDVENATATLAKLQSMDPTNTAVTKLRTDIDALRSK